MANRVPTQTNNLSIKTQPLFNNGALRHRIGPYEHRPKFEKICAPTREKQHILWGKKRIYGGREIRLANNDLCPAARCQVLRY